MRACGHKNDKNKKKTKQNSWQQMSVQVEHTYAVNILTTLLLNVNTRCKLSLNANLSLHETHRQSRNMIFMANKSGV
jgi:hypothetical protein